MLSDRLRHLLIAFLLLAGPAIATEEFVRVNALRAQAGLPPLAQDERLAAAAAWHAAYLDRHREPGKAPHGLSSHTQRTGLEGFSGETPADRAIAAGYPHREVQENISMGYPDAQAALDGLMAALYHRLTFLDLEADQLGVAVGERSRVFLLGRSDIGALCVEPPPEAAFRRPVDCLGQPMTRDHYEALCAGLPEQARFRPSHPFSCPNDVRLDPDFMATVCERPPAAARFRGHGRYYAPCDNGTRLDAGWFDALCSGRFPGGLYTASGQYYELCDPPRRVAAEWFEAHCATLPEAARYRDSWRFRRPCAEGADIRVEYLDGLDAVRRRALPAAVMWPPDAATGIPPAFYLEEPDPLPDLAIAGYPVSIQFNPLQGDVALEDFRLYRLDGEARIPVERVRLLDQASDPHGLLGPFEFALFPLDRLDWDSRYLAEVAVLREGRPQHLAWTFTTEGGLPLLEAAGDRARFSLQPGRDYLLYLPPRKDSPHTVLRTRAEHRRGSRVDLEALDPNTLKVRIEVRVCDRIRLAFDDGRRVELVPDGCGG